MSDEPIKEKDQWVLHNDDSSSALVGYVVDRGHHSRLSRNCAKCSAHLKDARVFKTREEALHWRRVNLTLCCHCYRPKLLSHCLMEMVG